MILILGAILKIQALHVKYLDISDHTYDDEVNQHYEFMTESSMSSRVTIYGL